jgi:MFS family permease
LPAKRTTLCRGIQGIGGAILISNTLVIVGLLFAPAERAKYVGIVGSASAPATIAGPALGGSITDSLGWQWVFFIKVPLGGLALLVILFVFPSSKPSFGKKKIDWKGALLLTVAALVVLLPFRRVCPLRRCGYVRVLWVKFAVRRRDLQKK